MRLSRGAGGGWWRALTRITAGPLILRGVVAGAGFAAIILAVPGPLRVPQLVIGALLLGLMPAILPGSPWVSALEFVAVIVWAGTTTLYRIDVAPAQVLALAVALYLHHTAAAVAAVVPPHATLAAEVVRDWAVRTGMVLGCSVALGVVLLGLPDLLGRSASPLVAVVGLAALLAAGYGVVLLVRRP